MSQYQVVTCFSEIICQLFFIINGAEIFTPLGRAHLQAQTPTDTIVRLLLTASQKATIICPFVLLGMARILGVVSFQSNENDWAFFNL